MPLFTISLDRQSSTMFEWKNQDTIEIEIPSIFKERLLTIARLLDEDESTTIEIRKASRFIKRNSSAETISEKELIRIPTLIVEKLLGVLDAILLNEVVLIKISRLESRSCLFCGSTQSLTKEHVFPDWLSDFLPQTGLNEGFYAFENSNSNESTDKPLLSDENNSSWVNLTDGRCIPSHNYTLKLVCAQCNNGWMSALEGSAKSMLEDLILSEKPNLNFSQEESEVLALWSYKTALVISRASQHSFTNTLPEYFYHKAMQSSIPYGIWVEISSTPSISLNYTIAGKGAPLIPKKAFDISRKEFNLALQDFFLIGFKIGHLVFRVSFLPPNSPIQRQQILQRVNVIHPYGFVPSFFAMEELKQQAEPNLELLTFCSTLSLVDKKTYEGMLPYFEYLDV